MYIEAIIYRCKYQLVKQYLLLRIFIIWAITVYRCFVFLLISVESGYCSEFYDDRSRIFGNNIWNLDDCGQRSCH